MTKLPQMVIIFVFISMSLDFADSQQHSTTTQFLNYRPKYNYNSYNYNNNNYNYNRIRNRPYRPIRTYLRPSYNSFGYRSNNYNSYNYYDNYNYIGNNYYNDYNNNFLSVNIEAPIISSTNIVDTTLGDDSGRSFDSCDNYSGSFNSGSSDSFNNDSVVVSSHFQNQSLQNH